MSFIPLYEADLAALPFLIVDEAEFVASPLYSVLHEADSAASLLRMLLYEADCCILKPTNDCL